MAVSVLGQTVAVVVEAVEVEGLAGEDVFTVTAGAVPIDVAGGDPIGVSAGLVAAGRSGWGGSLRAWAERGQWGVCGGRHRAGAASGKAGGGHSARSRAWGRGHQRDQWGGCDHGDCPRQSTHAGADGLQDFTTTVSIAGWKSLWLDVAMWRWQVGDDQVVLLAPSAQCCVCGNAAAHAWTGSPQWRQRLRWWYPGSTDTVLYQPTGSSWRWLTLVNLASVVGSAGGTVCLRRGGWWG